MKSKDSLTKAGFPGTKNAISSLFVLGRSMKKSGTPSIAIFLAECFIRILLSE
jgi:hypothetical protein